MSRRGKKLKKEKNRIVEESGGRRFNHKEWKTKEGEFKKEKKEKGK